MRAWQAGRICWLGAVLVLTASVAQAAQFAGGTGEPNDPYQIASAEQLVAVGQDPNLWDKHFILTCDLDMKGIDPESVRPIGTDANPFLGVLDGKDHSIANLCLVKRDFLPDGSGLFACIGINMIAVTNRDRKPAAGHVRNLHLENVDIHGEAFGVGGLAGFLADGTIKDCTVSGIIRGEGVICRVGGVVGVTLGQIVRCRADVTVYGDNGTGGLAGEMCGAEVSLCSSSGRVEGTRRVGGLIGVVQFWDYPDGVHENKPERIIAPGAIVRCRSNCSVNGKETIGGLIGHAFGDGKIEDCCAAGRVSGAATVGGLLGENEGASVIRCYSTGRVMGEEKSGGLIGSNELPNEPDLARYPPCRPIVERVQEPNFAGADRKGLRWRVAYRPAILGCFWDGEASGVARGIGAGTDARGGIVRLTTAEMRTAGAFRNFGWDFENVWAIREGQACPQLRWEQERRQK